MQVIDGVGCGGLQQSERTQVAVPGGFGGNRLKHQRLSEQAWIIDGAAERPPRRTGSHQFHPHRPGGPTGIPPPLAPSSAHYSPVPLCLIFAAAERIAGELELLFWDLHEGTSRCSNRRGWRRRKSSS
jgi:hypothetical protein